MKENNSKKQWEFDDIENQTQSKKDNQDIFSAENWFVEGEQAIETPVAEKQSWEDYIVTEDEVVIPIVANAEDNQPTVKDNENKEVSATAKPEESKNKKLSKKSLIISLCAVAVTLSIVLGVIFIPDWDTDVSIDNELPIEEQMGDEYISTNEEPYSNVIEDNTLSEESTSSKNKSNLPQTEEKTTRKNNKKEITTSVTEEPETTTRVAVSETTTNKGENFSITDSTTKKTILDDLSKVDLRDTYPGIDQTLGPGGSLNEIDWESVFQDYEQEN